MLVRERLDRFLVFASWLSKVPFLLLEVVHQASFDHDVIILDTMGKKPRNVKTNSRLLFRFEKCRAKDVDAKNIIEEAW